ncbi:transposase [Thermomonospora echinospora]|uniref:Transposase n=1 Tax=Thermomonospora echinospora TaxID=1992 RepID=A0A1H6E2F7_9ACTN|nr:transposase [Thermomonospora echinospora]
MGMKVYPPEFKADAVALYLSDPTRTYASVARDLGINRETLRLWVRNARTGQAGQETVTPAATRRPRQAATASAAGPAPSEAVLEEENRQLRARVRELEAERDILCRAAKYFAGETSW